VRYIFFLFILVSGCASGVVSTTRKAPPAFPVSPIEVKGSGVFFDGGTRFFSFKDREGVEWTLLLPQAGTPQDASGRRTLVLQRGDTGVSDVSGSSAEAGRLESAMSQWLRTRFAEDKVLEMARRSVFGKTTDLERDALIVIDVIAGIRVERMIETNGALDKERAEIAAELVPAFTKMVELQAKPGGDPDEVEAMRDQEQEFRLLLARWGEFYRTINAIVRHPAWVP
jgi:hypothetical protein